MDKKSLVVQKIDEMRKMHEAAVAENREFTADEEKRFGELKDEVRKLKAEISAEEREAALDGFSNELPKDENREVSAKTKEFRDFILAAACNEQEKRDLGITSTTASALAPEQFIDEIIKGVEEDLQLVSAVKTIRLSKAGSLGVPVEDTDASDAAWTAEVPSDEISADTSWKFRKRALTPVDLTKLIKVSSRLLKTSAIPVDTLVRDKLRRKMGVAFEKAIVTGTGSDQPLGVFVASNDGIPASRDVTAAGATQITGDDLIKLKMSLKPSIRRKAKFLMSNEVLLQCMLLKDSNGQYLWQPSLQLGQPDRLCGLPVIESEFAPSSIAAGAYTIVCGDFDFYWFVIVEQLELKVLGELFSLKNQVGYKAYALADGAPVNAEAFSRLKMAGATGATGATG